MILQIKNNVVTIDDEDLCIIESRTWWVVKDKYTSYLTSRLGKFHRVILNISDKKVLVDHINRNGLDNRKCNLRICTISENNRNVQSRRGVSKYKGVSWNKVKNKWQAQIKIDKKQTHLGFFKNEEEAAISYNQAAVIFHKEFAFLNVINKHG